MEKMVTIDVWSDNWKGVEIINILHDFGYKTCGMTRAVIGIYEENVEWSMCKSGERDCLIVSLIHDEHECMHTVDDTEEKPLFLYKLNIIVEEEDTEEEDTEEEREENKMENATLNIGMVTRNYMPINISTAEKIIGLTTDCTITRCTGYYKGHKEPSLKVEIYGVSAEKAVDLAHEFARDFNQDCVACTIKWKTVFVGAMATLEERKAMTEELKNQ